MRDFIGNEWDVECLGCDINNGKVIVPGGLIFKSTNFVVHQDPLIPLPGFLVIASGRHYQSLYEMRDDEYREFSILVRKIHTAIKEVTKISRFTLVQEEDSVHFHLWFFPWTDSVVKHYGKPSLTKIREIMSDLRKNPIAQAEWSIIESQIARIRSIVN